MHQWFPAEPRLRNAGNLIIGPAVLRRNPVELVTKLMWVLLFGRHMDLAVWNRRIRRRLVAPRVAYFSFARAKL